MRIWTLAALALLLCSDASAQSGRTEPAARDRETDQAIVQSLKSIAIALEAANKDQEYNPPCARGEDNRGSDLCAQWKAADAADRSASWTERTFWLGLVGTVIGAFTLFAAIAAAAYARLAAIHA